MKKKIETIATKIPWNQFPFAEKHFWRRKSTYKFQFKKVEDGITTFKKTIDLEKYTMKEIMHYTESTWENLDELFKSKVEDSCFEIADCIFTFKYNNGNVKKIVHQAQ